MSFPRYPEYKDSGVDWLGEVPAHWRLSKLKHLARFTGGGTPSRENMAYWGGDIPWVSPKDMKTENIVEAEESISAEGFQNSTTSLLPPGHVLMVVRSGILKHTIPIAINRVSVALNQDMKALGFRPNECLGSFFLRWVQGLNRELLLAWAKQGATVESIEHSYLAETCFPLPSVEEQSAIAAFLDLETAKIDALVAEQEKLIALLKEKRQAVISHAVTKGLDPDVPMKDSGIEWLGEVPAHWKVRALKSIVSTPITDGPHETPTFLDEGVPFVSAEAVSSGSINFDKIRGFISAEDHARYSMKYRPQRGDIYMVKSGATTGVTAIVETDQEFNIWSPLAVIRCSVLAAPRFVLNYLRSKNFQEAVALNWSFGTQQNIGMGVIENLAAVLPSVQEQVSIAAFLDRETAKLDALITEAEKAIELLKQRRTVLISGAVTGKIDVRGLVAEEEVV